LGLGKLFKNRWNDLTDFVRAWCVLIETAFSRFWLEAMRPIFWAITDFGTAISAVGTART